jgi:hypothetical protein
MQTIKINGKKLRVSASDERCLWILKESNFAAKKSEFVEGRYARYRNTILPRDRKSLADLGISEQWPRTKSTRARKFFEANPRCQTGIFGNPRRINAILAKIGAAE